MQTKWLVTVLLCVVYSQASERIKICNDTTAFDTIPQFIIEIIKNKYPKYKIPELRNYLGNGGCVTISNNIRQNRTSLPCFVQVDLNRDKRNDFIIILENNDTIGNTYKLDEIILMSSKNGLREYRNRNIYETSQKKNRNMKISNRIGYLKAGKYKWALNNSQNQKDSTEIPNDGFIQYGEIGESANFIENDSLKSRIIQQE